MLQLSAIVPNYNHARFLPRAIAAIANQDLAPDEIVVVDDGSTDDSLSVLNDLARQHPTLRVVRHEHNQGAIAALNRGIAEARGRYIYFGAADDEVLPNLCATGLALLKQYPQAAFSCAETRLVDEAGTELGVRPPIRPLNRAGYISPKEAAQLLRRADNWAISGTAITRRDLAVAAGGLNPALGSFADGFLFRRLALTHGFCFTPKIVALWRVREESYSRATAANPQSLRDLIDAARHAFGDDSTFPAWYGETFERRLRFGAARLALQRQAVDPDHVTELAGGTDLDRLIVRVALGMPRASGRPAALGWLALRKRPVSALALVQSLLARRLEGG